jgi:hypothetical protein
MVSTETSMMTWQAVVVSEVQARHTKENNVVDHQSHLLDQSKT